MVDLRCKDRDFLESVSRFIDSRLPVDRNKSYFFLPVRNQDLASSLEFIRSLALAQGLEAYEGGGEDRKLMGPHGRPVFIPSISFVTIEERGKAIDG
jgi:hypothetical protein